MATSSDEVGSTSGTDEGSLSGSAESEQDDPQQLSIAEESEEEGEISSSDEDAPDQAALQSESGKQHLQGNKRKRTDSELYAAGIDTSKTLSSPDSFGQPDLEPGVDGNKRTRVASACQGQEQTGGKMSNVSSRVPQDRSQLPRVLWQKVFTFLPPPLLARNILVNQRFCCLLDAARGSHSEEAQPRPSDALQFLEADAIWAASRKRFCLGMPKPLEARSERDMWQILFGNRCLLCGKVDSLSGHRTTDISKGLLHGKDHVDMIWPLRMRSCGVCLAEQTQKEIDILITSSVPSTLLVALPSVFLGPSQQVITPTMLQMSAQPPQFQMAKCFSKSDIKDLLAQFDHVKSLGAPAAEEWIKGLEARGKERMHEAERWERWVYKVDLATFFARLVADTPAKEPPARYSTAEIAATHASPTPASPVSAGLSNGSENAPDRSSRASQSTSRQPTFDRPGSAVSPQGNSGSMQGPTQPPRVERNLREVNELKAARRAEIERRCSELDPPLPPAVLNHMDSFQASVQISTHLTDNAWDVLKPRLLAQREAAEQKENDRIAQNRSFQAKFEERRQQEATLKEAKELQDKVWDEVQAPVRERLGEFAQQLIKEYWMGGDEITNDTSPKFAADVLLYVRKSFYDEISEEDAAARRAGQEVKRDPPDGPPSRKLILENMKWVFDTQIKPLTERFRKELFLCNGCENNFKFYGFEGVIQHYAAKHTNTLSLGSVVVHWRAEWPAFPPFHPDPSAAKAAFYAVPPPGQPSHASFGYGSAFGGYPQGPGHVQQTGPNAAMQGYPPFSPSPYGHSQYPDQYHGHPNGPFPPPPPYPGAPAGFHGPPQGYPPGHPNGYQGSHPGYPAPPAGYQGPYHGTHQNTYGSPLPGQAHPAPLPGQAPPSGQPYPAPPAHYGSQIGPGQPHDQRYPYPPQSGPQTGPQAPSGPPAPTGGMYQTQLEELAKIARDIWTTTSGIKDLPSSVRTYIVIHQVVSRFKSRFSNEPALHMFIDGLANQPPMKPLKNFNGLACRACAHSGVAGSSGAVPPSLPSADRKLYTLPNLLNHFQAAHFDKAPNAGYNAMARNDWRVDMVDLPDQAAISALLHAPGMDDRKLHLIAQVFPDAFPRPLPKLGPAKNAGPVPILQDSFEDSARNGQGRSKPGPSQQDSRRFPKHPSNGHRAQPRKGNGNASAQAPGPSQQLPAGDESPSESPEPRNPMRSAKGAKAQPENRGRPNDSQKHSGDRPGQTGLDQRNARKLSRQERRQLRKSHPKEVTELTVNHGPPIGTTSANSRSAGLIAKRDGSEDGEVSDVPADGISRAGPVHEDSSQAAERFLDSFLPGEDTEAYKRKAAEHDRRREEQSKRQRWTASGERGQPQLQNAEERMRRPAGETSDTRSRESDLDEPRHGSRNMRVTPVRYAQGRPAPNVPGSPPREMPPQPPFYRPSDGLVPSPGHQIRPTDRPGVIDPRYAQSRALYHDEPPMAELARRPRSRYDRYENYRKEGARGRSLSPSGLLPHNEMRARDTSPGVAQVRPEQAYRYRSPAPVMADRLPTDDPRLYQRSEPHSAFPAGTYVTYANDPRSYGSAYPESMEYMPVRMSARSPPPQQQAAYAVGPRGGYGVPPEYERYEEEAHRRPVYDERGQVYRVERGVYAEEDPRAYSNQHVRY